MRLAAALEIIDADGGGGLSMRRLARALDRDPMILYRHTPHKAACSTASPIPSSRNSRSTPPIPDWTVQLRTVARDYRVLRLGLHRLPVGVFPLLRVRQSRQLFESARPEASLSCPSYGSAASYL